MPENKTIYLKDYKVSNYLVEKIDLIFDLYENETIVKNKAVFYKNELSDDNSGILKLHGEGLELLDIKINGETIKGENYFFEGKFLCINSFFNKFELEITTKIHPETNTELEGLYKSNGIFCTQCEAEGFRRITYYLDRPDVMACFTTRIIADKEKYPFLLSNGNKIEEKNLENGRHSVLWEDPFKKPCYLFALVAGNLDFIEDFFITMSGKKVILRIFSEKHNIEKCNFAMEALKKSMKWDEDTFGLEYDLDLFMIVAVDDFNSGAMENKGLNIFNSQAILASPKTTTDNDYIYIERVVAHEYFHNWTGDRVTCRDWFQLSLKEGLTVYRDSRFTADMHSKTVKRIDDVKYLRDYQFKEDSSPIAHPIRPSSFEEIRNFYTVTVYEKGAEVIKMYETILGKDGFRKGMDLYFKRHDGQAVTTEDFLNSMSGANNVDLSQFQTWYDQAGTPEVNVKSSYDLENKTFTLNFSQTCIKTSETQNKKPFIIPIKYGLLDNQKKIVINEGMFILNEFEQTLEIKNIENKPIPSLLRDFSAPVILNYDYTLEDYLFLIKYDNNDFNRFEAFQKFSLEIIINEINNKGINNKELLLNAFFYVLKDEKIEDSLKAEMIVLPSESFISSIIGDNINPTTIFEIRENFILYLASELKKDFEEIYNRLNILKDYKIDALDIANRKLKNICLDYLSYVDGGKLAYYQYNNANNMTDVMGALRCLVNIDSQEKDFALKDFYEKWKTDSIVLNKWFLVQATSKNKNTLENIKNLEKNEFFDIKNPNKVRSLFNSFAMLNSINFHNESGEGYKFIADKVIEINSFNSQIAARLAKTLISFKNLEPKRRKLLRSEVERISNVNNLSPDVSEIINAALS